MKKKVYSLIALLLLVIPPAFNQTTVPGGEVEGELLLSGSPYLAEGEINMPADKTLTIEPGVKINFNGRYKLIIYGCLLAERVMGDSNIFATDDLETGWHGLRLLDTETYGQPLSKISYCIVENGKSFGICPDNRSGGIATFNFVSPEILNNEINDNQERIF